MACSNICQVCLTARVGKQLKSSKINLIWVYPVALFIEKWLFFTCFFRQNRNYVKLEGCNHKKNDRGTWLSVCITLHLVFNDYFVKHVLTENYFSEYSFTFLTFLEPHKELQQILVPTHSARTGGKLNIKYIVSRGKFSQSPLLIQDSVTLNWNV